MNHLRNIKDILSIPTGSRNVVTSGYSSLTDSQFFFGSQFWPENSQGTSQDMSLSSRNSQQSSQEGSDPKFASIYLTKPLLFGDLKDKTRTSGILDKFEDDRKKAKEKTECSDLLAKECQHIRETLNCIQQQLASTEKNTAVCQTVLEKIETFSSTLQNNLSSLHSDISQQFETLVNKVNSQKEVMTELEDRVQKSRDTTAELVSQMQILKNILEGLREEQERQRRMLEEVVKPSGLLVSVHSAKPSVEQMMDSAIQTSPALQQSALKILQENKLKGTKLSRVSLNLEQNKVEVSRQGRCQINGKRKFTPKIKSRLKNRPLVLSQKSKCTLPDENSQPLVNCNRHLNSGTSQDSLAPGSWILVNRETKTSEAARCFITPLSYWSQDSNSPSGLREIEPILEKLSAESTMGTMVTPVSFWQLFDMNDSDVDF